MSATSEVPTALATILSALIASLVIPAVLIVPASVMFAPLDPSNAASFRVFVAIV